MVQLNTYDFKQIYLILDGTQTGATRDMISVY